MKIALMNTYVISCVSSFFKPAALHTSMAVAILDIACSADWQPSTSRHGRNIQRPARHAYVGDYDSSDDGFEDGEFYRPFKQQKTTARQKAVQELRQQQRSEHHPGNGQIPGRTSSRPLVKVGLQKGSYSFGTLLYNLMHISGAFSHLGNFLARPVSQQRSARREN